MLKCLFRLAGRMISGVKKALTLGVDLNFLPSLLYVSLPVFILIQ